jgi:hypothetical protein
MADTTTTNYSFTKPEVGASEDTWGTKLNANWDSIDSSLKAVSDIANAAVTSLADLSVTATAAELNYVDGVTSNVQTQLNAKAPTDSPTFTGTVNAGDKVNLGSWNIYDSGTTLIFQYGSTDVFKIDSSGNITAEADVTAYGTV